MALKGIFFDLFGTLLVYGDMVAAWNGWRSSFHEHLGNYGVGKEKLDSCLHGFYSRPLPTASGNGLTQYEHRIRSLCADELKIDVPVSEIRILAKSGIDAWARYVLPDEEAVQILNELNLNKTLALVSNFDHPPHVHSVLQRYGYKRFFETVVISGEVGVEKPDPKIMHIALDAVGLKPEETAYVGDSAEDMDAARSAGMFPILIRRGSSVRGGNTGDGIQYDPRTPQNTDGLHVITRLSEIREFVKASR